MRAANSRSAFHKPTVPRFASPCNDFLVATLPVRALLVVVGRRRHVASWMRSLRTHGCVQFHKRECAGGAGVEGRVGRDQAGAAHADRRGEVEAVLDGVPDAEGDGPCRLQQPVVRNQPDGTVCKI